jgi:elongation factor Ts
MAIDAKLVKDLRELTGLPMMTCKKALEEAHGDVEQARDILRKHGEKVMESRAGRQTKEGRVAGYVDPQGKFGILVSLRCESEPVAKCEDFMTFLNRIVEAMKKAKTPPMTTEDLLSLPLPPGKSVREGFTELVGKIRENIQIGDFKVLRGEAVFQYVHFDNRHGSMVVLKGANPADPALPEVGKNLCMHVVFARPRCLRREEVPSAEVEKEREILLAALESDPKQSKKPPEIRKKIVEGQLGRFYQERCLPEQPFVRDDKISVEQYLKQQAKGTAIETFCYVGLT